MKKILLAAIAVITFSLSVNAQNTKEPKPYVVHTMYINGNEGRVNLDSLLKIWKERVMDPNPYFLSTKIVKHFWGHDSREVLFIYELKNWNDVEAAFNKRNEIIKAHKGWASEADAKAFGKLWWSVFAPEHHSDEIYEVVAE